MSYPVVVEENWAVTAGTTQKFTLTPNTGSEAGIPYQLLYNPTQYEAVSSVQFDMQMPIDVGQNFLNGGIEFAPIAIPLVWEEMDWGEYSTILGPFFHMQQGVMIDVNDDGYEGFLYLEKYTPLLVTKKKGQVTAKFCAIRPANGLVSTINTLTSPSSITLTQHTGGSIPNTTQVFYWLTFWTPWGESAVFAFNHTYTVAGAYGVITWTPPTSNFYTKARLYAATTGTPTVPFVMGEVLASQTQQWTDYSGVNGIPNTAPFPTANKAYTGLFKGGVWQNMT